MPNIKQLVAILFLVTGIQLQAQYFTVEDTTAKKLNVKTATKKTFFGDSPKPSMSYTEFYDKNGKVTEQLSSDEKSNTIAIRQYFFYNDKGQLEKETGTHYTSNDSLTETRTFAYNKYGHVISAPSVKIVYKYDKNGRVTERIEKNDRMPKDDLKFTYSYNAAGQLIKQERYFLTMRDEQYTWDYDNAGRMIKETQSFYDSNKTIPKAMYEHTYYYDEKGLMIKELQKQTVKESGGKMDNRTYLYEYTYY